jgi:hypothetical protein
LRLRDSDKEGLPKDPTENIDMTFLTPEGNFTKDKLVLGSILISLEEEPALLDNVAPFVGKTSKLLT